MRTKIYSLIVVAVVLFPLTIAVAQNTPLLIPSPQPSSILPGSQTPVTTFNRNLSFGMRNDSDILILQRFLIDEGFLSGSITGNFFILTRNAVKKFQVAHGVRPSGFFGPQSRAVANVLMNGTAAVIGTAGGTARGIAAALDLSKASSTPTLIAAVSPTSGGRSVFLPLSLSLQLAKDSYELDERLDGTGSIVNPNPVPAPAKFNLELFYKDTLVKTVIADFPCANEVPSSCIPIGTTSITPADVLRALVGFDRIPVNPDFIGSGKLVVSMIPVNSAIPPTRIESPFMVTAQKPATISIDGGSDRGQVKLLQGFLIGPPDGQIFPQPQLVADLKPKFWRTSQEALLRQLVSFHTEITFATSDLYVHEVKHTQYAQDFACQPPNPPCAPINPWENTPHWQSTHPGSLPYDEYKDAMKTLVKYTVQNHLPIGYWEWWSEPNDYASFGTEQQMFETFKAFHDAIRQAEQETGVPQKILAPNVSSINAGFNGSYDGTGISRFLDYVSQNHLRIDAIAWHELDADPAPETTPEHVARVRNMLAQKGFCPGPNCPRIYINEYSKAEHHLIPGWTLGRLSYFDQANIDGGGRSCWNAKGDDRSWIDCYSLDGLFMQDNATPQPLYWVHRLYADMDGDTRLSSQSSALRTTAIATKNDQTKMIRILASHYSCGKTGLWCKNTAGGQVNDVKGPPVSTTITIQHYPYAVPGASVQATFQLVPNPDILPSTLSAPITLPPRSLTVKTDGSLAIQLTVGDGDVYSIVLTSANVKQAPILSQIIPPSGPIGTKVTLMGTGFTPTDNTINNTINFGGVVNAVINLSSTDGRTLSFAVPSQLCNQLSGSAVCLPFQPGTYDVSVTNVNGVSNAVKFEVTPSTGSGLGK